jgi:hypothetical protein
MKIKQKVIELRDQGKSIPEICNILNIKKGSVGYHLKDYNGKHKGKRIVQDDLYSTIKKNHGDEILGLYALHPISYISKLYDVSQCFVKNFLIEHGVYKQKNRKLDIKSLIDGNVTYNNPYYGSINESIKKYIFKNNIFKYECNICGIDKWNSKPIGLDLDHIDGNRNNNILNNLRLLCPNCHSQTHTYKNKLRKKQSAL